MSSPEVQILKSYVHFSWWEFSAVVFFYASLIVGMGFDWPVILSVDSELAVFNSPFWFMMIPVLLSLFVSSRLASLQYYSIAFMAPHYRYYYLKVGMSLIVVLGWLPMFANALLNSSDIATYCGVVVASSGVALLLARGESTQVRTVISLFATVAGILITGFAIKYNLSPRWELPLWLSMGLLLLGVFLMMFFIREFLKEREYRNISALKNASGLNAGDYWLRAKPIGESADNIYSNSVVSRFNGFVLKNRIADYKKHKTLGAMTKLVASANLEAQISWFYFGTFGLATVLCFLIFVFSVPRGNEVLSTDVISVLMFALSAAMTLLFGLIVRMSFPTWSISNVWLRMPFTNKKTVMDMMIFLRVRIALVSLLLFLLSMIAVMEYLLSIEEGTWTNSSIRIFWTALIFDGIGFVFCALAVGLIFERFSREWTFIIMAVFPGMVFIVIQGMLNNILPSHLQETILPAAFIFFVLGVLLISITAQWWYGGYFNRRDNNLL